MRVERRVFAGIGAFIVPWAVVYWFTSYEAAGSLLLAACATSMLFLAAYLLGISRNRPDRPEDLADGAGAAGEDAPPLVVPSASIWPFVLGLGATLAAFAAAYQFWLAVPGLGLVLIAVGGMIHESSGTRGTPRHHRGYSTSDPSMEGDTHGG